MQAEYEAIQLAMDTLSAANQTLQNRFSPALGARTAEIFSALTGGRYDKVLLDRTLALSAEPSGDPTPRSIQVLSQGAADQLYLAVRLAICQLVLPPEKHVPLMTSGWPLRWSGCSKRVRIVKFCCSPAMTGSGPIWRAALAFTFLP